MREDRSGGLALAFGFPLLWIPFPKCNMGLGKFYLLFWVSLTKLGSDSGERGAGEFPDSSLGSETLQQSGSNGEAVWVLEQPQGPAAQEEAAPPSMFGGEQSVDALEDQGEVLLLHLRQPKFLESPGARVLLGDQRWPEPAIGPFITEEGEGAEFGFGQSEEADSLCLGSLVVPADIANPVNKPDGKAQQKEGAGEGACRKQGGRNQHGKDVGPEFIVMGHQDEAQPQKRQEPKQHRSRPQAGSPLSEGE